MDTDKVERIMRFVDVITGEEYERPFTDQENEWYEQMQKDNPPL